VLWIRNYLFRFGSYLTTDPYLTLGRTLTYGQEKKDKNKIAYTVPLYVKKIRPAHSKSSVSNPRYGCGSGSTTLLACRGVNWSLLLLLNLWAAGAAPCAAGAAPWAKGATPWGAGATPWAGVGGGCCSVGGSCHSVGGGCRSVEWVPLRGVGAAP
jgi:hypothetical protein